MAKKKVELRIYSRSQVYSRPQSHSQMKRGSSVQSDISSNNIIVTSEFWQLSVNMDGCTSWLHSTFYTQKCEISWDSFLYVQFGSKGCLYQYCHLIGAFEYSWPEHVTRNVAQNTRASLCETTVRLCGEEGQSKRPVRSPYLPSRLALLMTTDSISQK